MQARSWLEAYPNEWYGITRQWVEEFTANWFDDLAIARFADMIGGTTASPDSYRRVAERDGKVVGFVFAFRHSPDEVEIRALYCDPAVFGTGVGAELMASAMDWAGPAPAWLNVTPYNERAIRFYRRFGFHEVAGSEHLINVMAGTDFSGHPGTRDGLALNLNALPVILMEHEAQ